MADRIKAARLVADNGKKLGQVALSKKVGVSHAAVSQWEKGDTVSIGADKLLMLAKALKVRPEWLVFGTPPREVNEIELDSFGIELAISIGEVLKEKRSRATMAQKIDLFKYLYEEWKESGTKPTESNIVKLEKFASGRS